jgi:predicted O-linked N-acetylglucosamine transferase (SPINDLY family)
VNPEPPPAASVAEPSFAAAVALHQAGRLSEAAVLYEQILTQQPEHFDALHLLGVTALQQQNFDRAKAFIERALTLNPRNDSAIGNLGTVYLRTDQFDRALEQFRRAVELQPTSVDALTNLGTVLYKLNRVQDALVPLRRAFAANPSSALIANLLGACLLAIGDPIEATRAFEAATVAEPDDADGWSNLAIALSSTGQQSRAMECVDRAVSMRPGSAAAVAARAAVQFEEGSLEAAIASYEEAVALSDPSAKTICAYANALWSSGRCDEALENLGKAVSIDGGNVIALWKLAMSQCRTFYATPADVVNSRKDFSEHLNRLTTWFRTTSRPEAYTAVGSTQPFFIAYQPFNNRDLLRRYGDLCVEWMSSLSVDLPPTRPASSKGKMRVGIASAHIRDHSVWNAITKGWVRHIDKDRFDMCLFHLGHRVDAETEWARHEVAHFEMGPKTLKDWVEAIAEAQLDMLIYPEIGMDALTTQLASLRLAPVQAAAWGHPETTGLPTMDLYLSADGLEPADARNNYTERLVRLPHLGVHVESLAPTPEDPDFKALGLPSDEPLLLCPGTPFKYSPLHDEVWARIAKGLDMASPRRGWAGIAGRWRRRGHGRLVFFRSGNSTMDRLLAERLRRVFEREGVDFDARVCLIPYLDRSRFFGLMQRATLLLDTVGFSGFNNALQAIECSLPVLAFEGEFMRGRLASGIMRRMGLPDLVATSKDEFVASAIRLATDADRCRTLKSEVANRRGSLFGDLEPVRALERCLIEARRGVVS